MARTKSAKPVSHAARGGGRSRAAARARIVELRFFGGLTVEETAIVIGASPRTVKREWQMSRAWLKREMARLAPDAADPR